MKRSSTLLIGCARLAAIGVWPYRAAPLLGVSLRTIFRWLALPEVQEMIRTRGDRWRRDERRRKNAVHHAWLRDPVAQAEEAARKARVIDQIRAAYGGMTPREKRTALLEAHNARSAHILDRLHKK